MVCQSGNHLLSDKGHGHFGASSVELLASNDMSHVDSFESEESKSEAAAALASPSAVAIGALAGGISLARTRRRLLSHISGASGHPVGVPGGAAAPGASPGANEETVFGRISVVIQPGGIPEHGHNGASTSKAPTDE